MYVELSWSTFILEVINFIVLVFILKHFFYKPVLTAIARRRESIDKNNGTDDLLLGKSICFMGHETWFD